MTILGYIGIMLQVNLQYFKKVQDYWLLYKASSTENISIVSQVTMHLYKWYRFSFTPLYVFFNFVSVEYICQKRKALALHWLAHYTHLFLLIHMPRNQFFFTIVLFLCSNTIGLF